MSTSNWEREVMRRALEQTADCPALDELTSESRSLAIDAHLEGCAHCKNELALFTEFAMANVRPQEAGDVSWVAAKTAEKVKAATSPAPWWKAIFAPQFIKQASFGMAALLMIASGVFYASRTSTEPAFPGETPTASTLRATSIQLIEPLEDINSAPSSFVWQELTNCSDYQVIVSEVDRMQIWSSRTTKPGLMIPEQLKKQVLPGKTLLWKVIAYDAAGKQLAESETRKFRVTVK